MLHLKPAAEEMIVQILGVMRKRLKVTGTVAVAVANDGMIMLIVDDDDDDGGDAWDN